MPSEHQFPLSLPTATARLDADAKRRAKLAFVTYERAVRDGDEVIAQAARQRFLEASADLKRSARAATVAAFFEDEPARQVLDGMERIRREGRQS